MKKMLIALVGIVILTVGIIMSCQKSGKEAPGKANEISSTITTVYERDPVDIDPSIFADHIIKIEVITRGDVSLNRYEGTGDWARYIARDIDLSQEIRRYTYDNSPAQVIVIPLTGLHKVNAALIYTTADSFLFARFVMDTVLNDHRRLGIESLDGSKFYFGFDLNHQGKIGNFLTDVNMPFDGAFGNRATSQTCFQQFPSDWGKCMGCAYHECMDDWLCGIACAMGGTATLIGCSAVFALHCANVGNPKSAQ